jgi:hypothetical protein
VIAISRDPLASVAVANGVRRVRHALDAYRFARGRGPDRLSMLGDGGLLAESALTSPEGRPYYYRKRHDGAVLLAPER